MILYVYVPSYSTYTYHTITFFGKSDDPWDDTHSRNCDVSRANAQPVYSSTHMHMHVHVHVWRL